MGFEPTLKTTTVCLYHRLESGGPAPEPMFLCVALHGLATAQAQIGPSAKSLPAGLQAPGPTRVSLPQPFFPPKVTAGDSMLLLGHILILLGGVYLLVGQVRAPPIPPDPHPMTPQLYGLPDHPEGNVESCQEGP